jgi:hypothetical protein
VKKLPAIIDRVRNQVCPAPKICGCLFGISPGSKCFYLQKKYFITKIRKYTDMVSDFIDSLYYMAKVLDPYEKTNGGAWRILRNLRTGKDLL